MTKIIGIDLDEVLAETLDQILEDNNYKVGDIIASREHILDYHIYKIPGVNLDIKEASEYFYQVYLMDNNLKIKVVEGAKEKIQELKNKGYTLKIVSARPTDVEKYTLDWLDKHFNNTFESVHFANHFNYSGDIKLKRKKSEICKELGITIMVEDLFDYALDLAENGIYTFLLEKPWNKHITSEHPNIKRIRDWSEINI